MNTKLYEITCPTCASQWHVKGESIIHAQHELQGKQALLDKSFFTRKCSHCGTLITFYYPFLYCDPKLKLLIALDNDESEWIKALDKVEHYHGYTKRVVHSENRLKELIAIYDYGLEEQGIFKLKERIMKEAYEYVIFDALSDHILWFETAMGMIGIEQVHYHAAPIQDDKFVDIK